MARIEAACAELSRAVERLERAAECALASQPPSNDAERRRLAAELADAEARAARLDRAAAEALDRLDGAIQRIRAALAEDR